MKVGIQLIVSNHADMTDANMFRNEIKLGVEAEAMGFDYVACVEQHFTNYVMCPAAQLGDGYHGKIEGYADYVEKPRRGSQS